MWQQGKGLNLRPCPPELRQALLELAHAKGLRLYPYVFEVLAQHVQECRRPAPEAETVSAMERASA
jgi:hypothetical protein